MEKKVWHYLSNIRRAKNLTQNVMGVARAMLINLSDLLFDSPPEVRLSVAILIDCRYPSLWLLFKQLWF